MEGVLKPPLRSSAGEDLVSASKLELSRLVSGFENGQGILSTTKAR